EAPALPQVNPRATGSGGDAGDPSSSPLATSPQTARSAAPGPRQENVPAPCAGSVSLNHTATTQHPSRSRSRSPPSNTLTLTLALLRRPEARGPSGSAVQ